MLTPQAGRERPVADADTRALKPGSHAPQDVQAWLTKLREDFTRAHLALKALVVLSTAAERVEQERYRGIIDACGMLRDTEVPPQIVKYYRLTEADLGSPVTEHPSTQLEGLLALLKALSDTKTCLKYIFALIQQGQDTPLLAYVTQVKASTLVTRDPSVYTL